MVKLGVADLSARSVNIASRYRRNPCILAETRCRVSSSTMYLLLLTVFYL